MVDPSTIILSADLSKEEIELIAKKKALPIGTILKLDRAFWESEKDKDFITFLEEEGFPVFCDTKIAEITSKCQIIARPYLEHSPYMVNIMGNCVSNGKFDEEETNDKSELDCLKQFALNCKEAGTRPCIVTVLTNKTPEIVKQEYGRTPIGQVLKYVDFALQAGFTDVVCSPAEVVEIRKFGKYDCLELNTPGIRLPESDKDDQARIATPYKTLKDGANHLVIGRPLLKGYKIDSNDLVEVLKRNYDRIVENIETGR